MRWDELRKVGATAREMLCQAAAKQWRVARSELTTGKSMVAFWQWKKRQLQGACRQRSIDTCARRVIDHAEKRERLPATG